MKADNMYNRSSKAETRGIDEDRDGGNKDGSGKRHLPDKSWTKNVETRFLHYKIADLIQNKTEY